MGSDEQQLELVTITASADSQLSTEEDDDDDMTHIPLNPKPSDRSDDATEKDGRPSPRSSISLGRLALSSMVAAGVQFGWALQLSLLTPYVQTLGIEHALSSFIWLCGPITGLVVQPCVGIWSDKCRLRFGRRRPFIFGGVLLICLAVIIIGFAADIGYFLGDTHEDCRTYKGLRLRAAIVFILGFWLLDLANNTVQGPARALLGDLSGPDQRDNANAIFCLWMALGNVLGFSAGSNGQWHKWFPFVTSQACCEPCGNLKAAFLIAIVFLVICTAITLWFANEIPLPYEEKHVGDAVPLISKPGFEPNNFKDINMHALPDNGHVHQVDLVNGTGKGEVNRTLELENKDSENLSNGPGTVIINLLMGVRQLPPEMKSVLVVMALSWLSWFPFFLFDTDWMGREVFQGDPKNSNSIYQLGVQEGAFGLLLNSVVLGISSFLIDPLCRWLGSKYVWALSSFMVFFCMASTAVVSALAVHQEKDAEHLYVHTIGAKVAAVTIFALLGLPLAITYSVPYSITSELAADSGGGQGLAMGILNLAIVVPQIIVALGAGPWDALFGGGNEPAFAFAALFAFTAGVVAWLKLPQPSKEGYKPVTVHGFG